MNINNRMKKKIKRRISTFCKYKDLEIIRKLKYLIILHCIFFKHLIDIISLFYFVALRQNKIASITKISFA